MRRSTPGKRNLKSDSQTQILDDNIQPPIPPHDPKWEMQYGCSRKTGWKTGGCFWNPPDFCDKRIIPYGGERWVMVCFCKTCPRYLANTCPARQCRNTYPDFDEPKSRKPRRRSMPNTHRTGSDIPNESARPQHDRPRRRS